MDKETAIHELFMTMKVSLKNASMYNPEHPAFTKAVEDMKEKLSWYLAHDNEREKVAKAGYERGRKQHTFTARINQIFDCVRKTL